MSSTADEPLRGAGPELLHDPKVVDLYLGGVAASVASARRSVTRTNSGRPTRASSRRKLPSSTSKPMDELHDDLRGRRRRRSGRSSTGAAPAGRSGTGRRRTTQAGGRRALGLCAGAVGARPSRPLALRRASPHTSRPSMRSARARGTGGRSRVRVLHGRASLSEPLRHIEYPFNILYGRNHYAKTLVIRSETAFRPPSARRA